MRVRFLIWFLFLSCTRAISSSGLHRNFSSEQRGLNSSKTNMHTQKAFENYGSIKEAIKLRREDEKSNNEEKYELSYDSMNKAQRGRGATGSANVNHHPRRSINSATPLLSWISTLCVSLTLMLVFSFHIKVL